jgi:hypothetical protein
MEVLEITLVEEKSIQELLCMTFLLREAIKTKTNSKLSPLSSVHQSSF